MSATCECVRGHTWLTDVIEDDPDTDSTTVRVDQCPECGSDDFEIVDMEDDFDDTRDF